MALNTQLANATVNAQADAIARLLDGGIMRLYSGTQPATADTALSGNTLLAELPLNATFAPAAVGGLLTANPITSDSSANASGTATFARLFKADGTTVVMDLSVGTSAANLIMATNVITAGQTVSCSSFTHDVLNSSSGL